MAGCEKLSGRQSHFEAWGALLIVVDYVGGEGFCHWRPCDGNLWREGGRQHGNEGTPPKCSGIFIIKNKLLIVQRHFTKILFCFNSSLLLNFDFML